MKISRKYIPYLLIILFTVLIATIRYYLLAELPWYFHLFGFFGQVIVLSLIWNLIKAINKQLEKKFSVEEKPGVQISLQVLITVTILSPLIMISYNYGKPLLTGILEGRAFVLLYVIFFLVILFLTFSYYSFELFRKHRIATEEKMKYQLETVQLEKEKTLLQYHQLREQINPHFLFNTFSSLDSLVHTNPSLASEFIRHLSKVYRYVLDHNEKEVVPLETELRFIDHYISLLKIRYGRSLEINTDISVPSMEKGIVMVTLQMLIDNAIKHNAVYEDRPLRIDIESKGKWICVRNNKQERKLAEASGQRGLLQLKLLYAYLHDQPVAVVDEPDFFEVRLPLL